MKDFWKMSASFIAAFKACAYRCYAQYVLGIRMIEESETLRTGTNWHKVLEVMGANRTQPCQSCMENGPDPDCSICEGTMKVHADPRKSVLQALNAAYADKPASKSIADWAIEKMKLWIASVGYAWVYEKDDFEVIAEEIPFEIPLFDNDGVAIPGVVVVGKIDKITRSPQGTLYVDEHKSTSKPIDSDSLYWSSLNLDTQTTLYVYAARLLQSWGDLEKYGISRDDSAIAGVRYDVWHKPQIRDKELSMADTKRFLESTVYMDETFELTIETSGGGEKLKGVSVNGVAAEITLKGKKKDEPAIRETAEMYGARLLKDIIENPGKHFARKCVARTDDDLKRCARELTNIYRTVKFLEENDCWWRNEQQCEATFKCPYINTCYNNITLDPENPPEGFVNIFKKEKNNGTKKTNHIN